MLKIFTDFKTQNDFEFLYSKFNDKPITVFNDYIPKSYEELNHNPYNIIIIHEPNQFFGMHSWVMQNRDLFSAILTWSEPILNSCDNAIFFDHGARAQGDDWLNSFKDVNTKNFEVTFLAGAKKLVEGHRFRQELYNLKDQITIPNRWYYVLDDFDWDDFNKGGIGRSTNTSTATFDNVSKRVCYNDNMFHVAVENIKANNWYTEKIGDAFVSKTVPIYWGCPNIGSHFDSRGIITFNTKEELLDIVNNLTPELYYEMKPYVDINYELVKKSFFPYTLSNVIQTIIDLNHI